MIVAHDQIYSYCENAYCVCICVSAITSLTAKWINFKLSEKMHLTPVLEIVNILSKFDYLSLHIIDVLLHFFCINASIGCIRLISNLCLHRLRIILMLVYTYFMWMIPRHWNNTQYIKYAPVHYNKYFIYWNPSYFLPVWRMFSELQRD